MGAEAAQPGQVVEVVGELRHPHHADVGDARQQRVDAPRLGRTEGREPFVQVEQVGEFFAAFEGMYDGFKLRAARVYEQLRHPSTAFVVVATPDDPALKEAAFFARRLAADGMPLGALVVNRVHRAGPVPQVPADARRRLAAQGADGRLLADLLELHDGLAALAGAEQRRVGELLASVPNLGVVQVPQLADDVHDLAGLRRLGGYLFGDAA